jgi:phosphoribosyl 1,2-cyclic phosphate phosphodiesterase
VHTLVINALRKETHNSHFTLDEALEFIACIKPQRAFLTHLSHQMGTHTQTELLLPPGVFIAYDGLKISI